MLSLCCGGDSSGNGVGESHVGVSGGTGGSGGDSGGGGGGRGDRGGVGGRGGHDRDGIAGKGVLFVLLLCLEHSQEEPSKARAGRHHPTFRMKTLKPNEETALSFHIEETLPSCLLVPNAQNLVNVEQP